MIGMMAKVHTRIRADPFSANYELAGKELGRGKFAVVKKCTEKATGKQYAAKFLRKRRKGQDCRVDILNEIAVLELAKCNPYVVALHEVYETATEIVLVLECAGGGEIFDQCVADNDDAFTEKDVIRLARQILMGVAFLHCNNVVHLDLKVRRPRWDDISPLAVDFIKSLLVKNPRKRATAEECLSHPWLKPHPLVHHHLHAARSSSSLDEPDASDTSQSEESEPESPAPSPELGLMDSYLTCPCQGELKTGCGSFSFAEPPFAPRPEIQQELIC
uniref:non-specific serine/threonine protein kinase n=1 Tax=Hippocampus comes TaxID=109280 RepID=A0A3Q3D8N9_HIPCM